MDASGPASSAPAGAAIAPHACRLGPVRLAPFPATPYPRRQSAPPSPPPPQPDRHGPGCPHGRSTVPTAAHTCPSARAARPYARLASLHTRRHQRTTRKCGSGRGTFGQRWQLLARKRAPEPPRRGTVRHPVGQLLCLHGACGQPLRCCAAARVLRPAMACPRAVRHASAPRSVRGRQGPGGAGAHPRRGDQGIRARLAGARGPDGESATGEPRPAGGCPGLRRVLRLGVGGPHWPVQDGDEPRLEPLLPEQEQDHCACRAITCSRERPHADEAADAVVASAFRPTPPTQEPHLLHRFADDFYGKELRLVIAGYLRPELNFESVGAWWRLAAIPGLRLPRARTRGRPVALPRPCAAGSQMR